MRVLREVYDFITGGSIAAPVGLVVAVLAAELVPAHRAAAFITIIAVGFAASTFERAS